MVLILNIQKLISRRIRRTPQKTCNLHFLFCAKTHQLSNSPTQLLIARKDVEVFFLGISESNLHLKYTLIYIFDEFYESVKKGFWIIVLHQMATIRTQQKTTILDLISHPFHMFWVHGVVS